MIHISYPKRDTGWPGRRTSVSLGIAFAVLSAHLCVSGADGEPDRRAEYVTAVTRGEGYLPWQQQGVSTQEIEFRNEIERRKDEVLVGRNPLTHPVMLTEADFERARRHLDSHAWAQDWYRSHEAVARYIVEQPDDYVDNLIPELTATKGYGFTCPNCLGRKSQESAGYSLIGWDYRKPDMMHCRRCGQEYPDASFPETAKLVCPRTGQTFTYYLNEDERRDPDDRSGKLAWHWVGKPVHLSFTGVIREQKVGFSIGAVKSLAIVYRLTGDPRYAAKAVRMLERLAHCYRNWLYHDYWDTIADCDPMYAAWHDRDFPLEWKRHLCADVFAKDTIDRAAMLQTYWGAGRTRSSTDSISALAGICLAYDLVHDASDTDGSPLWTPELRAKVERDLILEWVMGGEPYVGGHGQATCANNKAPRIYHAQAAVATCLGLPGYADTALRGYEAVRDHSFLYDGFSTESPAYTNMYLARLVEVPEMLHGFRWPEGFPGRSGVVDQYQTDGRLRLMFRAVCGQLRADGRYLPLSDTNIQARPSSNIVELGLRRYPEYYAGALPPGLADRSRDEYAVFHADPQAAAVENTYIPPETLYPAWMTAILRHGTAANSSLLSMVFNPDGGHRHHDNLAVYYVDRGREILGDHGYVGDMPVNSWIKSTLSHNLVIVDDREQRHRGDRPRRTQLRLMATSPHVSVVEASSDAYEQCGEYRRLVALVKGPEGQTFSLDIFRVAGGEKHAYRVFSELASSDADGELVFAGLELPSEAPLPEVGESLKKEDIFGLRDVRVAKSPPKSWQVSWAEPDRCYRLWMLSEADRVEASNGPGQRTLTEAGRRVRYVDTVREGQGLASTYVALHEPSGIGGAEVIQNAGRLSVPETAGDNAVALRVESSWGTYRVFSEFEREAEVDGIRFQGQFGVACETSDGARWMLALGAETFLNGELGFSGETASWISGVEESTDTEILAKSPMPSGWPALQDGFQAYLLTEVDSYGTGFPIDAITKNSIRVSRFPMPRIERFAYPALRFVAPN